MASVQVALHCVSPEAKGHNVHDTDMVNYLTKKKHYLTFSERAHGYKELGQANKKLSLEKLKLNN